MSSLAFAEMALGKKTNQEISDRSQIDLILITHDLVSYISLIRQFDSWYQKKPNELLNRRAEKSADKSCDQASSANACVHSLRFKAIAAIFVFTMYVNTGHA